MKNIIFGLGTYSINFFNEIENLIKNEKVKSIKDTYKFSIISKNLIENNTCELGQYIKSLKKQYKTSMFFKDSNTNELIDNLKDIRFLYHMDEILKLVENKDKIIIISSLSETSALLLEIIALLKKYNKNIFVIATIPFSWKGKKRRDTVNNIVQTIEDKNISIKIFENDELLDSIYEKIAVSDVFKIIAKNIYSFILDIELILEFYKKENSQANAIDNFIRFFKVN